MTTRPVEPVAPIDKEERLEILESLKACRRWLNYYLGNVYVTRGEEIVCKICGCRWVMNDKRTGGRIDHNPDNSCGLAAAAIYRANDVIEKAGRK
jgi:hypothetical protein